MNRTIVILAVTILAILALSVFFTVTAWAEGNEIQVAAAILRGETSEDCEQCRELTACSLVDDMRRGVYLRGRWNGWRRAREEDVALIVAALETGMCNAYPQCRFLGNGRDMETFARNGWADGVRLVGYCGHSGCSICIPRENVRFQMRERVRFE